MSCAKTVIGKSMLTGQILILLFYLLVYLLCYSSYLVALIHETIVYQIFVFIIHCLFDSAPFPPKTNCLVCFVRHDSLHMIRYPLCNRLSDWQISLKFVRFVNLVQSNLIYFQQSAQICARVLTMDIVNNMAAYS